VLTKTEEQVLALVDREEVTTFMQELIRARSDYPPGDTREIAQLCVDMMSEAGIDTKIITPPDTVVSPLNDGVPNEMKATVIGTLQGESESPSLLLNAHMDTVAAGDLSRWKHDPFAGVIEDGYIYGRGAGDDKGSVCAQVMAATYIARAAVPLKGTLFVNPIADEEAHAWRGARWMVDERILVPDMAIVGEQTDNEVAVGERAIIFCDVTIKGKAAHGAMPWAGNNAILRMNEFINLLRSELEPALQENGHPYLPPTTLSPNTIKGGTRTPIIAEECTLTIDCRLSPPVTHDQVVKGMEDLLKKLSDRGPAFEWHIETPNVDRGFVTDVEEPVIQALLSAYKDVTGREPVPTGYNQHSDGSRFARLNIPIAIFGPSDPRVGHAANERVSIDQLVEATKVYILAILRLLS
jgi:succinyl-diaminopimelate desuccinylase